MELHRDYAETTIYPLQPIFIWNYLKWKSVSVFESPGNPRSNPTWGPNQRWEAKENESADRITPQAVSVRTYSEWTTSVQLSTSSVTLNKSGMCLSTSALESEGPVTSLYPWRSHTHTCTYTGSERPNYLLENAGTQEAPDWYQEPTQGSLTQPHAHSETKGISCLCLNPWALDTSQLPSIWTF